MKKIFILLLFISINCLGQTKYFKHDYKKFIDCRINWNIDYSLSNEERIIKYGPYLDKEIVILTTDGSRQKFTMKRGYIRMTECNNKKYINFQDNDTTGGFRPFVIKFWGRYTYSYFAECYDSRNYR